MKDEKIIELLFARDESALKEIEEKYGAAIEVVHCLDGDVSVTPHPVTNDGSEGLTYRIVGGNGDFYAVFTGLGTCTDGVITDIPYETKIPS